MCELSDRSDQGREVDEPVELDRIATVPTWPTLGGFGFKTGDQGNWRLFNEELQWMDGSVQGNWEPLQPAKPDDTSPCGRLQKVVNDRMAAKLDQDGFESQTLVYPPSEADEALCIVIKRGGPEPASGTQTREQVLVSLYNPRHMRALHAQLPGNKLALPPALATVVAAERRRPADPGCTREDPKRANGSPCRPPDDWYIGSKGDINGWIAVGNVADKAHVRGPLTTEALRRLGCDVLRESLRAQKPGETPPPQCLD